MIFQHTLAQVLDGSKTHTSRLALPGDELKRVPVGEWGIKHLAVVRNGRVVYYVTQTLAVQPGRGSFSIARIRVTDLARYDARNITGDQLRAEGFERPSDFLFLWCRMHDWKWYREYLKYAPIHGGDVSPVSWPEFYNDVCRRPAEGHYAAWDIGFSLLQGVKS